MKAILFNRKLSYWRLPALIALVVFLCFMPTLKCGFVNWDDDTNYINNRDYRGLSYRHLSWMFTSSIDKGLYMPVTWLTLGLDYILWGMNPAGYHLTNLLLHVGNSVLFYFLILKFIRMGLSTATPDNTLGIQVSAAIGTLFYAIHPLRVESVAWITERRDVLSAFFYLLTVISYLQLHGSKNEKILKNKWFYISLFCFTCSLLSKPWAMTLPVIFIILDIYPLRLVTFSERYLVRIKVLLIQKIPYFILAFSFALLTALAQQQIVIIQPAAQPGIIARSMQATYGLFFYIWKTVIPVHLSPLYLMESPFNPFALKYVISASIVTVVTIGLILLRNRRPWALTAWVCYVLILSPVLGFFQNGAAIVADRYTYISIMPFGILIGTGMVRLFKQRQKQMFVPSSGITVLTGAIICFSLYSILTVYQIRIWRDGLSLWQHALHLDPTDYIAHTNLGSALENQGRLDDALKHYYEALRIQPYFIIARYNVGNALKKQGRKPEAIEHYREVLGINPDYAPAHNNLATSLISVSKIEKVITYSAELSERTKDLSTIRYHLKNARDLRDTLDEAIFHFKEALRITPDFDIFSKNIKQAMVFRKKIDKAVSKLQDARHISKKTES